MMMPHSTMQREMTRARRARHERPAGAGAVRRDAVAARRRQRVGSLRVQIGHALIVAGRWLSDERVEAVRPSAHRAA